MAATHSISMLQQRKEDMIDPISLSNHVSYYLVSSILEVPLFFLDIHLQPTFLNLIQLIIINDFLYFSSSTYCQKSNPIIPQPHNAIMDVLGQLWIKENMQLHFVQSIFSSMLKKKFRNLQLNNCLTSVEIFT